MYYDKYSSELKSCLSQVIKMARIQNILGMDAIFEIVLVTEKTKPGEILKERNFDCNSSKKHPPISISISMTERTINALRAGLLMYFFLC